MSGSEFIVPPSPTLMRHSAVMGLEPTILPYTVILQELKQYIDKLSCESDLKRIDARIAFEHGNMNIAHEKKRNADVFITSARIVGRVKEMLELTAIWLADEIPQTDEAVIKVRAIVHAEIQSLFGLSPEELHAKIVDYDIAYNLKHRIRAAFV